MNQKISNLLIGLITSCLIFVSCSPRDRMTSSNARIDISSTAQYILPQNSMQFSAKVYSPSGKQIDESVSWSASVGNIDFKGMYISPNSITDPVTVRITATLKDISSTVHIRLVHEIPDTTNKFYIYADEYLDMDGLKLDTINYYEGQTHHGDENGGYLGFVGMTEDAVNDSSDCYEGLNSLKLTYPKVDPGPAGKEGEGIYFQFGYKDEKEHIIIQKDLSAYTTLHFQIKIGNFDSGDFNIKIETNNNVASHTITDLHTTEGWVPVTVNIANELANVASSMNTFETLTFCAAGVSSGNIYIDNVYFEK